MWMHQACVALVCIWWPGCRLKFSYLFFRGLSHTLTLALIRFKAVYYENWPHLRSGYAVSFHSICGSFGWVRGGGKAPKREGKERVKIDNARRATSVDSIPRDATLYVSVVYVCVYHPSNK